MTDEKKTTALAPYERSIREMAKLHNPDRCHFLAPKTLIDEVPDGMRLVATRVDISPDPKDGDVYPIPGPGGKLGIGKAKLNQIAQAIGMTWVDGGRLDNRKNPHYCEWMVIGRHTLPDGSSALERASKTIDLRDKTEAGEPGADLAKIKQIAKKKNRDPSGEIAQQRAEIQSLAETKAKNRAIRAAATIHTGYTRDQLAKPFVAIKLAVDPRSELGQRAIMANVTGATAALFGPPPTPAVTEAQFEEVTPPPTTDEPPTADPQDVEEYKDPLPDLPPFDAETGEVTPPTKAEIDKRIAGAWGRVRHARPDTAREDWRPLFRSATGKTGPEDLTWPELDALDAAVTSLIGGAS
jgi:hypothetical protein